MLVAAVSIHHPYMPKLGPLVGIFEVTITQVDNVLTVRAPRCRDIAGQFAYQREGGSGQRRQTTAIRGHAIDIPMVIFTPLEDNAPTIWLPVRVKFILFTDLKIDQL